MDLDNIVKKRKVFEELKTKKQKIEERLKILNEQTVQLTLECKNLGVNFESLDSEVEKLKELIDVSYKKAYKLLEGIGV